MKSITLSTMKYPVTNLIKGLLIYYGIMITIMVSLELLVRALGPGSTAVMNNFEFSSSIFIFVMSLNILKQDLKFYSANGLTRKQLFGNVCLSAIFLSGMVVVLDSSLGLIYGQFTNYASFAAGTYPLFYQTTNPIISHLFMWSAQLFVFALGFFVSNTYYKLNSMGKVIVSVSVPGLLLIGIPYVDGTYFHFNLTQRLVEGFMAIMGLYPVSNPFYAILTFVLTSCILAVASYALMRRAILKDA